MTVLPAAATAQTIFEADPPVRVRTVAQKSTVRPGDPIAIAVEIDHDEGFHTWPNEPVVPPEFGQGFFAVPTTIDVVAVPPGWELRQIQWPEPQSVTVYYTLEPIELISYTDRAVAYVPVIVSPEQSPGRVEVRLKVGFQACDETTCFAPEEVSVSVPLRIVPPGAALATVGNEPELFADFDAAYFSQAPARSVDTNSTDSSKDLAINVFGLSFAFDPGGRSGLALLLLVAALGGLLLNFTPCVLPVVPLKIMSLAEAARHPRRLLALGTVMALGVVSFWLVLGAAIAFVAGFDAISSLFQTGWFAFVVGGVVALMAFGTLGAFQVTLPQPVYRLRPEHDSVHGSYLFGVLTAVLSTPCTAPLMGAAAAWAVTQEPRTTILTFAAVGAGMAGPYLLLSARPGLVARMPRSGPGSVLLKQVLGLLMLAVAAFYFGLGLSAAFQRAPDPPSRAYWWAVALFVSAAFVWMAQGAWRIAPSRAVRTASALVAALVVAASGGTARGLSSQGPIEWTYYTPERFTAAAATGEVIVLEFTAEWCLNCRALEEGVLNRPATLAVLESDDVTPMRVDLTSDNPAGKAKLKELGWLGIPLVAVFGPGTGYANPIKFDTYTQQMILDAVAKARGRPVVAGER